MCSAVAHRSCVNVKFWRIANQERRAKDRRCRFLVRPYSCHTTAPQGQELTIVLPVVSYRQTFDSGHHKEQLNADPQETWVAVLLEGVVTVGVLAWGSYSRDTFSFEATNMNAWVEGGLSDEYRRLVERGAPLQIEHQIVRSADARTFEIFATGTMDKKTITGKVIVTTSMRYDMTHDMLYLVARDSNCVVPDGAAAGSRPGTASQLCMALSASIREAFNRIPLQITPERGRGLIAYVSVDDLVAGNIRTVTLTFVRLKLWMLLCVLVIVVIPAYAVYIGWRFPRHEVRTCGRSG
jgi:hypothetical protein